MNQFFYNITTAKFSAKIGFICHQVQNSYNVHEEKQRSYWLVKITPQSQHFEGERFILSSKFTEFTFFNSVILYTSSYTHGCA